MGDVVKVKKTYVCFVLDRSGSMKRIRSAIIKGFNEQVEAIRQSAVESGSGSETYVSLYTFNHEVEPRYLNLSVNHLQDLKDSDYEIIGDTAMYDAVGAAIEGLEKSTNPSDDNAYVAVIVSDGAERCSKKFTQNKLAEKIKACQDTGQWTFVYVGANQNLAEVAEQLNIPLGNMANYEASGSNTRHAMKSTSANMSKFLRARAAGAGGSGQQTNSFHGAADSITDYSKAEEVPDNSRVKAIWRNAAEVFNKKS